MTTTIRRRVWCAIIFTVLSNKSTQPTCTQVQHHGSSKIRYRITWKGFCVISSPCFGVVLCVSGHNTSSCLFHWGEYCKSCWTGFLLKSIQVHFSKWVAVVCSPYFSSLVVQDFACLRGTPTTLHCNADYSILHHLHSSGHGGISLANILLHYRIFFATYLCTIKVYFLAKSIIRSLVYLES